MHTPLRGFAHRHHLVEDQIFARETPHPAKPTDVTQKLPRKFPTTWLSLQTLERLFFRESINILIELNPQVPNERKSHTACFPSK